MVSIQTLNSQEQIELHQEIGRGGEATIYRTNKVGILAKIYDNSISLEKVNKLKVMLKSSPKNISTGDHIAIAWPQDLLIDIDNQCCGFIMPEIKKSLQIINAYNYRKRKEKFPKFTWYELHKIAFNLASIIQYLHTQEYVIGDLKPQNLLVNKQGLVSIIDTDSFQVFDSHTRKTYLCPVTSPEYTAPEMLGEAVQNVGRSEVHDRFPLAIIIWQLLFGYHPYSFGDWIGEGNKPNIDKLIRNGNWIYGINSQLRPGKQSIPLEILHFELQQCFYQCFDDGHNNPNNRPSAEDWVKALDRAIKNLGPCSTEAAHYYNYARDYGKCYWCKRKKEIGSDIFVSQGSPSILWLIWQFVVIYGRIIRRFLVIIRFFIVGIFFVVIVGLAVNNIQNQAQSPKVCEIETSGGEVKQITEKEVVELINRWLKAKPKIFGSSLNLALAAELTIGEKYNEIKYQLDRQRTQNIYYEFGNPKLHSLESLKKEKDNCIAIVKTTESFRERYKNSVRISTPMKEYTESMTYGLKFAGYKWKIVSEK